MPNSFMPSMHWSKHTCFSFKCKLFFFVAVPLFFRKKTGGENLSLQRGLITLLLSLEQHDQWHPSCFGRSSPSLRDKRFLFVYKALLFVFLLSSQRKNLGKYPRQKTIAGNKLTKQIDFYMLKLQHKSSSTRELVPLSCLRRCQGTNTAASRATGVVYPNGGRLTRSNCPPGALLSALWRRVGSYLHGAFC